MAKTKEQKTKKKPERRCVGCSEHKPKASLLRVVRGPDGTVSLDFTGKKAGRGAYVCRSLECFRKARKARRFEANLEVTIPEELYDALEKELASDE